ncbi:hypothetical protein NEQ00_23640, partial [Escherichia coli]|nr:hypothetical protein [Escherichia coli]MDI1172646.1 hypothetical protein [Escherichia coli]
PLTDFGGKTSIFSHPVYLFLREFSLQDFRGGSSLDDWTKNLKHKSEKDLEQWIIARQGQSEPLTNLMDQYVLMAYRTSVDAAHS